MDAQFLRTSPLYVLVVLAEPASRNPGMLSGLGAHCALVCASAPQAVDAARKFVPNVVIIDSRRPDCHALATELGPLGEGQEPALVALAPPEGLQDTLVRSLPEFHYRLPWSALACELEQMLWQVRVDLEAGRTAARNPWRTDEKIG